MPASSAKNPKDPSRGRFTLITFLILLASIVPVSLIDFPAGDSWTHGWMVREWANGNIVFNDWSSAIALPQQVLGWILHLGSDTVNWPLLAVMTAIVTILGCAFCARLPSVLYPNFKELKNWAPLFLVLCLAPTFTLKVGAGFMTDGYYLFFLASSLYILALILSDNTDQTVSIWVRRWIGFACLATLATLQRTHGITVLFIAAVWILFAKILFPGAKPDARFNGWRGWLPVILCAIGMIFLLFVLTSDSFSPARATEVTAEVKAFWLGQIMPYTRVGWDRAWLVFGVFQHLGLVLLPIAIIARLQKTTEEKEAGKRHVNWWYVGFGTLFMLMTLARWANGDNWGLEKMFPYVGNSLTPEGFGPRADTIALTAGHQLDTGIRFALTILGTGGGIILIWLLSRTAKLCSIDWRSAPVVIGFIGFAHLGLIFLNIHFFDRYLLPLIPFALCWMAPLLKNVPAKSRLAGWILVAMYLAWGLWGTVDSLAWTSAKWDLAFQARESGIPANQLVGGYEPDGFFNYSNETYPGLDFQDHPAIPWWVTRLGLQTAPVYVIIEKGADTSGTPWERYIPYDLSNNRMELFVVPEIYDESRDH